MTTAKPSLMHAAVMADDVSTLRELLARGASPDDADRLGFTPLHLAAQQWSVHAAEALLDGGASVDPENEFGNTPLFIAVFNSNGRGELIELLRSRGADALHANVSGQTPVGLARLIANYDVAKWFADLPA